MFRFLNGLRLLLCCAIASMVLPAPALYAAPIGFIGYDIENAITNQPVNPAALEFFGHTNSYSGTVTETGLTAVTAFGTGGPCQL